MSNQGVISWEETKINDHTVGIPMEHLNDFISSSRESFHFSNQDLFEKFSQTIRQLSLECDTRGLTSTVFGDLDAKTKIYALIHCVREDDDLLSVFYTVHISSCKLARKNVTSNLEVKRGVEKNQVPAVGSKALQVLEEMGVLLDMPSTPSNEKGKKIQVNDL